MGTAVSLHGNDGFLGGKRAFPIKETKKK